MENLVNISTVLVVGAALGIVVSPSMVGVFALLVAVIYSALILITKDRVDTRELERENLANKSQLNQVRSEIESLRERIVQLDTVVNLGKIRK